MWGILIPMRQAPGDLGKIQWDAAAGRSAIDNLPPAVALVRARFVLNSILERIDRLNDRYYPVQASRAEGVSGNEGRIVNFDFRERGNADLCNIPPPNGVTFNHDNHAMQDGIASDLQERIRLDQNLHAVSDSADVVSLFDRRLDRIFGRR
jgi:hypothetical protein